jgi:hypothetical protein
LLKEGEGLWKERWGCDRRKEYVVAVLWLRGRATGKPKRESIPVREKGFC